MHILVTHNDLVERPRTMTVTRPDAARRGPRWTTDRSNALLDVICPDRRCFARCFAPLGRTRYIRNACRKCTQTSRTRPRRRWTECHRTLEFHQHRIRGGHTSHTRISFRDWRDNLQRKLRPQWHYLWRGIHSSHRRRYPTGSHCHRLCIATRRRSFDMTSNDLVERPHADHFAARDAAHDGPRTARTRC